MVISCDKVEEHSACDPKITGSNLIAGILIVKKAKKKRKF
jgi:hypothetical protein